jgi:predicted molibdopterin-dependent oxidoreductase YjgC
MLNEAATEAILELNPEDAADLGLTDGDKARVTSAVSSIETPVKISAGLSRGAVFLPNFDGTAGKLVARPEDVKAMPAFKATAVKVERLS